MEKSFTCIKISSRDACQQSIETLKMYKIKNVSKLQVNQYLHLNSS
jgi:predicted nucleic-acid-binding Zn-ribbon protein